jgi:hypothetical protein
MMKKTSLFIPNVFVSFLSLSRYSNKKTTLDTPTRVILHSNYLESHFYVSEWTTPLKAWGAINHMQNSFWKIINYSKDTNSFPLALGRPSLAEDILAQNEMLIRTYAVWHHHSKCSNKRLQICQICQQKLESSQKCIHTASFVYKAIGISSSKGEVSFC